ncbi:hypothetical protein MNEG_6234 [Monoraphidium neglectum]|uniref:Uncharacterized protein n=1 Tax=Monoraphidium neglectum TaxID=145388 RepID=A0A0D2MF12_9CHLO|nr:hypothetical protein MNEG_6234 [Monoraphidium neglectum]KIZ01730.1 hypothetical protein MNEG_6234 [Monoraphidium neglectum]|eukprot:XP_013900749.1 hypothetical protein MNEG_6234 [Monoraphidium neglectum]
MRFGLAVAALAFLLAILNQPVQAADVEVNVCPAAKWLSLPFLRSHASTATIVTLVDTATGGGDLVTAGVSYLKTDIVPKIGANVFFFALSLLFLLIFLLWRFSRWCCYVLCCSSSCDTRRLKNDPYELLFTQRMTVHKVLMFLTGLAAIELYIYGMAGTSKTVVSDAFTTLSNLDTYLTRTAGHLDDLVAAVAGVNPIIDDLQAIVTNDVDVPGIEANITTVKSFLTTVTPPATLAAAITTLDTRVTTNLPSALAALSASLVGVAPGNALGTALGTVAGAQASAAAMTAALADLDAKIAAPIPASGSNPTTANAAVAAFSTSLLAAAPGYGGAWASSLDAISAAVDTLDGLQGAANNPLTLLDANLGTVVGLVTQITGTDIPALAAAITGVQGQWVAVQPALVGLAAQLVHINTTAAYASVTAATSALTSFFASSPTPAALAATLSTTTASGLALPPTTTTIRSGLTAQGAALNAAQFDATPGGSDGALLKAWVTAAKADITAAAANFNPMATARATFFATPTGANYDALKAAVDTYAGAAATTTLESKLGEQGSAPSQASRYAAAAPPISAAAAAAYAALPAFVTAAGGAVSGMPALGGYASGIGAVALPALTLFDGPQAALDGIQSAVVTSGDTVKGQVNATLATFSGATSQLQTMVLGRLDTVQADYKPVALKADTIRYQASMVLYALPILVLLVLLLCALLVNFHFGTNLAVLLLLVLLVLGFVLAAVLALVLAVLGDVCPAVEPMLLSKVPANMEPLAL